MMGDILVECRRTVKPKRVGIVYGYLILDPSAIAFKSPGHMWVKGYLRLMFSQL